MYILDPTHYTSVVCTVQIGASSLPSFSRQNRGEGQMGAASFAVSDFILLYQLHAVLFTLVFLRRGNKGKEIAAVPFCVFPFPCASVRQGEVS